MLDIVGGVYSERCIEPDWHQLFGSGLRAAATLSALSSKVTLHTYVDVSQQQNLEPLSRTFRFAVHAEIRQDAIGFSYQHPLAKPEIFPPIGALRQPRTLRVEARNILRFGMLEGEAITSGERVVYDPQAPDNPKPYHSNGSSAKHLAIVANMREAQSLTGRRELLAIGKALISKRGAEVAVIKQGASGAMVITQKHAWRIPAFKTGRIWPIGSGDVFSAVFAFYWAIQAKEPHIAAEKASLAAAVYCNNRTLPLPKDFWKQAIREFKAIKPDRNRQSSARVYLAGPFFTMTQRWLINEARAAIASQNVSVFSPFHDVGHGSAEDVVPLDINAIHRSSAMFAILDGCDPGTIFEVGYARALGIPVVAFVQSEGEEAMKMLRGTGCILCDDFATAIYKATWAAVEI